MTLREHLLTILAEECVEVAQRVSKALRFGLDEIQPGQPFTNAERVVIELADLKAAVQMAVANGALPHMSWREENQRIAAKKEKVERFLTFSGGRGLVEGVPADPTVPHPEAVCADPVPTIPTSGTSMNQPTPTQQTPEPPDHIVQFFASSHLPPDLRAVSKPFGDLAAELIIKLPRNPERTVALRKLLEAKDAAVRALVSKPVPRVTATTVSELEAKLKAEAGGAPQG